MDASSLGERLLASRTQKQAAHEVTYEIEVDEGQLYVTYQPLDFRQARKIGQRHEKLRDEIEKELRVAADTLAAASVKSEAHVDGQVYELPPLGLALAQAVGLDGPENDVQAVLAIFPSEMAVMRQFVELQGAEADVNRLVDDELQGNSKAVAST